MASECDAAVEVEVEVEDEDDPFGIGAPKQTKEEQRRDRLVRDMVRVRFDVTLMEKVCEMMSKAYTMLASIESDMIMLLNRVGRWAVFALAEIREETKWPDVMKRLTASANLSDSKTAYTTLANSVFLEIGDLISEQRSKLRELGMKAELRFKEIREPPWPATRKDQRSQANLKTAQTADKLELQLVNIRTWLSQTLMEFRAVIDGVSRGLPDLRSRLGISSLSEKELEEFRSMSTPTRDNEVKYKIEKALATNNPRALVQSSYLAECNRIRGFLSVQLFDDLTADVKSVDDQCESTIAKVLDRYPNINDGIE